MASFSLVPRDTTFDTLLGQIGDVAHRSAATLQRMIEGYPNSAHLLADINHLEHEADRVLREVVKSLHATFITPIDREDIYELARTVYDVTDHVNEAACLFDVYRVESVTSTVREQAGIIVAATSELVQSLTAIESPEQMSRHWSTIHQLEDAGDRVLHDGIREVFAACYNEPAIIICWKDIYTQIEKAIDACERAATVLEGVAVKVS